MIKDNRYKLSQEDVNSIRELRENGYSYSKISLLYPVCAETIRYWTDEEYRKKQRQKNALRKHKPLDKKRMARDDKKRKELRQDTKYKTRVNFQGAKDETRAIRKTAIDYRTGKRVTIKEALKILETEELHLGNSKIE
tara:strand:- start:2847 stop:3260 length:414 start_codon:yes stop_codon:yes gene_type:complete